MNSRRDRPSRPWFLYGLAIVAAAVVALAITQIGPPTSSARTSRQVLTAEQGVVQSTVTGSGNIAACPRIVTGQTAQNSETSDAAMQDKRVRRL